MKEFEFQISPSASLSDLDFIVESICLAEGLEASMKSSLASLPGSIHWHFKTPGERGTLEITFYPRTRRLWASIQAGRRADWIEPRLAIIKTTIEERLARSLE